MTFFPTTKKYSTRLMSVPCFCPHLEDALTQRFGKRLTKHRPFLFQKLQRHKYLRLHFHVLRQNELFRRS